MTDPDPAETSQVLEADFVKKASTGYLYLDGVIVYGHRNDAFEYLPMEGYEDFPTFGEMCETRMDNPEMTVEERNTPFHLKTPDDVVGSEAKVFLRVEEGTEKEKINAIEFYLNEKLGRETGFEEKRRRYTQMLWSHRDVLLKDYKYMIRSNQQPKWMWQRQLNFGSTIKYRADVITNGEMLRVRPRRVESVASTMSHESGLSRQSSFAFDQGEEAESVQAETAKTHSTITPRLTRSDNPDSSKAGDKPPGSVMRTVSHSPASGEHSPARSASPPASAEPPEQSEVGETSEAGETSGGAKKTPAKVTVTDDEIREQLKDVEVEVTINRKLEGYYIMLPKSLDEVPKPDDDELGLRQLALKLRPYANAYLEDINKKRMPTLSQTKKMSPNVARREYNAIKKAIEDRDKFEDKKADKQWAIAKKNALNAKRSKLRLEAKVKALDEKKKRAEEAKAKKAALEAAVAKAKQQELERAAMKKKKQSDQDPERSGTEAEGQAQGEAQGQGSDGDEDTVVEDVQEDSDEEVMPSGPSKSRSGRAPTPSEIPRRDRRSRAMLPDTSVESRFGVILTDVKEIWTELNSIRRDMEREERNHESKLTQLIKAMNLLVEDTNEIKVKLFKKRYHDLLIEADLERAITKYLPFDQIEPGACFLLTHPASQKAIAQHIWRGLEYSGKREPTLDKVVNFAARIVFSNQLRSFLKVETENQPDGADDPVKGWDRRAIPDGFYVIMESYVFKRWDNLPVKPSKSAVASRLNKDRPWKVILSDHLRNTRETYFMTLAYPYQYLDPMLNHRHTVKKAMYLHNHGEGERNTTVPSNRQEKLWFIEDSPNVSSLEDLKTAPVLRKRKPMSNKHGVEVDHEDMEKSVNELAAHYAGIPEFAGASFNIVQDGVPKATVVEAALEDDLRKRQGYDDFEELDLTRDDDESGSQRSRTPGSSAPGSPSKRGASKSRKRSGQSPTKKAKKTPPPKK